MTKMPRSRTQHSLVSDSEWNRRITARFGFRAITFLALFVSGAFLTAAAATAAPLTPFQTDADAQPTLEDLERGILHPDSDERTVAAALLVTYEGGEGDPIIRGMLAESLGTERDAAIVSLLTAIRVRKASRFLPEVLELLRRSNGSHATVRDAARETILGMRGVVEAERKLLDIFRESRELEIRVQVLGMLRDLRSVEALDILIECGSADARPSPRLEAELIGALESISGERFGKDWAAWQSWASETLLRGPDGELDRTRASMRINETLRRRVEAGDSRYVELTRKYLDELARMARDDISNYRAELVRLLRDSDDAQIRAEAADRIGELPKEKVIPEDADVLRAALEDPSPVVCVAVIRSLGKIVSRRAGEPAWAERRDRVREDVVARIESEFPKVQLAAVDAAGWIGGDAAIDALSKLLERLIAAGWSRPKLREAIVQALGRKGESSSRILLIARVLENDPVWTNRRFAAIAAGETQDPAAIEPLSQVLLDPEEQSEVRWQAGDSLGRFREAAAARALEKALTDADPAIRKVCAFNLGRVGLANSVPALAEQLGKEPVVDNRKTLIGALGKIADPGAVPTLESALRDESLDVVRTAQSALESVFEAHPGERADSGIRIAALRDAALAPFAATTLEKAIASSGDVPPEDPARVRSALALGNAYLAAGRDADAGKTFADLLRIADRLSPTNVATARIGAARAAARTDAPKAARDLRASLDGLDPATPTYWETIAVALEIYLTALETAPEGESRAQLGEEARRLVNFSNRPVDLSPELVAALDASAAQLQQKLVAAAPKPDDTAPSGSNGATSTPEGGEKAAGGGDAANPETSRDERVLDLYLYFASKAKVRDPDQARARLAELDSYSAEARGEALMTMLTMGSESAREFGIKELRKLFPDAKLAFDPKADAEARAAALRTLKAWWATKTAPAEGDDGP